MVPQAEAAAIEVTFALRRRASVPTFIFVLFFVLFAANGLGLTCGGRR